MGSDSEEKHSGESISISLKVMLVSVFSLFGMVLLLIFLHFYAKHLLRRRQRRRQIDYLIHHINSQIDVRSVLEAPHPGLDPLIIASLPKLLYKETEKFSKGEEATECSVCLGTIVEDATIRELPNCKHIFHVDCVDRWFKSNTTCPICRAAAEPRVQLGHGQLGTGAEAQPTAPPAEGSDEPQDCDDLEKVGCSGLRIGSFHRMVST